MSRDARKGESTLQTDVHPERPPACMSAGKRTKQRMDLSPARISRTPLVRHGQTWMEERLPSSFQVSAPSSMQASHLGTLFALARLTAPDQGLRILLHDRSTTARDKAAMLPGGVLVQESAIVVIGSLVFLVSGVGACQVKPSHLRTLAQLFALSAREANAWGVNPAWLPASLVTGMAEGLLSPFLPPAFVSACPCAAIVLLSGTRAGSDSIAIPLSFWTSLLVPGDLFPDLVREYAGRISPRLPLLSLSPSGDVTIPRLSSSSVPGRTWAGAGERLEIGWDGQQGGQR